MWLVTMILTFLEIAAPLREVRREPACGIAPAPSASSPLVVPVARLAVPEIERILEKGTAGRDARLAEVHRLVMCSIWHRRRGRE